MSKTIFTLTHKGGSGKTTCCNMLNYTLTNQGYQVACYSLDQQRHFIENDIANPDYTIIDSVGVVESRALKLLEQLRTNKQAVILIPFQTGINDQIELPYLWDILKRHQVQHKALFVPNRTNTRYVGHKEALAVLERLGARVANTVIPDLQALAQLRITPRAEQVFTDLMQEINEAMQ